MSAPWTLFPFALTITNADILACVQGGINKQYNRAMLLTAAPGDAIALASGSGSVGMDGSGGIKIQTNPGQPITITDGSTAFMVVTPDGDLEFNPSLGGTVTVPYTPAFPGDWQTAPSTVADAITALGRAVSNYGTTPIPEPLAITCVTALPLAFAVPVSVVIPTAGQAWYAITCPAGTAFTLHVTSGPFTLQVKGYSGACSSLTLLAAHFGGPGTASGVSGGTVLTVEVSGNPGDVIDFFVTSP
jgi:hypothetical protein